MQLYLLGRKIALREKGDIRPEVVPLYPRPQLHHPQSKLFWIARCFADDVNRIRVVEQEGRPIAKRHSSSPPPDEESKVVIDPQAGGQVDAKEKAQHKVLEAKPGQWVWAGLTKVLSVDLFK